MELHIDCGLSDELSRVLQVVDVVPLYQISLDCKLFASFIDTHKIVGSTVQF